MITETDKEDKKDKEVIEEKKKTIPDDINRSAINGIYKEEVIETEACKLMMDVDGNIHIECSKPTEKLKISKQELDLLQGLSTIVPNAEK